MSIDLKKYLIFLALTTCLNTNTAAKDKADVTYVGLGRYTCSGDKYKCAKIDANNRALDERDRQRWEREKERDYERRQRDLELYGVRR